jgi:hypothetical protein
VRGWLKLYQTSYKRPIGEIEWLRWSVKLRPADTRQDWPLGTAKLVGVAGMAAGYFCEEWHGQPTEKDQWSFHPTGRVASRTARLWTLGADHSDNCSSIAVYQLVL